MKTHPVPTALFRRDQLSGKSSQLPGTSGLLVNRERLEVPAFSVGNEGLLATLEPSRNLSAAERKTTELHDRSVEAGSLSVIAAYEAKVRDPEVAKVLITEKAAKSKRLLVGYVEPPKAFYFQSIEGVRLGSV